MKSKILLKILVLILFSSIIYGQDSIPQKTRRLHFYLGASLLTQKTDYTVDGTNIPSQEAHICSFTYAILICNLFIYKQVLNYGKANIVSWI